ncbi:hypothetical protein CCM_03771 [Cordyceps militaris CM01]|uniref:Uncharacterized protein n=1 Tax=Cordyceps militaris (strain CM01) TaxID=983644 RepID=G3JGI1_CORMM|nr:uncharacterized protein CCM_03771 [Cordyceps militaris CM01]EGX92398.1 hypothetical protein CCM_03771 [Cordyceps militaris CM01]
MTNRHFFFFPSSHVPYLSPAAPHRPCVRFPAASEKGSGTKKRETYWAMLRNEAT